LRNTKNILRSGGVFRLVLPDLEYLARSYLDNASKEAAIDFMRETYLGHESRARGYKALISMWLGNSQHLWMWDIQSIQLELENAGFCDVRRAFFGDSSDMKFGEVEEISRWASCLGVECRKQS
jgi:predicted SAM-dependent methyltransferase